MPSLITHVVATCARRPWVAIVLASALGASAFAYTATHIAIDTDSAKLIVDDVAWRKRELVFDAAFPHRADLMVVVVDGATAEQAEQTAATLTQRLSNDRRTFRTVWRPDGGAFFDRAGLLFEPTGELVQTLQRLVTAQHLLGT